MHDTKIDDLTVIGKRFFTMGHFQLFPMILKFSMGHFFSFYTDFDGPFFKLMGLWRMAPCLPNHCLATSLHKLNIAFSCYVAARDTVLFDVF